MSDLLVRDVDDELVRLLKSKAKLNGTSLQQEASKALKRGAPLTGAERRTVLEELRQANGGFAKVRISGAEIVRSMREEEG